MHIFQVTNFEAATGLHNIPFTCYSYNQTVPRIIAVDRLDKSHAHDSAENGASEILNQTANIIEQ